MLHQPDEWLFGPAAPYEVTGDVSRAGFPCGWVVDAPNDRLYPYYGAADTVVGLASARFSEVLARICASPMPSRPGERPTTRTRGDADKDHGRDHGAT